MLLKNYRQTGVVSGAWSAGQTAWFQAYATKVVIAARANGELQEKVGLEAALQHQANLQQ
jgi:hypothetical protein